MEWTKALKIAIVEEDINKIESLIDTLPQMQTEKEMQEAAYMMKAAYDLMTKRKDETADTLLKIKKQKAFLSSTFTRKNSFNQTH